MKLLQTPLLHHISYCNYTTSNFSRCAYGKLIDRIHVEREIGSLKQKYTILQSILPVDICDSGDDLFAIDKVVHVTCATVNPSHSVVCQD